MMATASLPRGADLAPRTRTVRVSGGRGRASRLRARMFSGSGEIGIALLHGNKRKRRLGDRRKAFRPIGLRKGGPEFAFANVPGAPVDMQAILDAAPEPEPRSHE